MAITITSTQLKAVALAMAKKDIRYYLNGVMINENHIVATDGHRMHIFYHGQQWDHGETVIPREIVDLALKMKSSNIEITDKAVNGIPFNALDGRFPDYRRVIPSSAGGVTEGGIVSNINADYLKDAVSAIQSVTGKKRQAFTLTLVGNSWFWSSDVFATVVMSYRADNSTSLQRMQGL